MLNKNSKVKLSGSLQLLFILIISIPIGTLLSWILIDASTIEIEPTSFTQATQVEVPGYSVPDHVPTEHLVYIKELGLNIPLEYVIAVALVESNWNWRRASPYREDESRDEGLFQINSKYQDYFVQEYWDLPEPFDVFNARHSMYLGAQILTQLIEEHGLEKGIVAYNKGVGGMRRIRNIDKDPYLNKVTQKVKEIKNGNS